MHIHSHTANTETVPPLTALSHCELISLCITAMSTDPVWIEFERRFDSWLKRYINSAWNKSGQDTTTNWYFHQYLSDWVQEVYLSLLKNNCQALKRFRGTTDNSFLAYLAVIATNVVRQQLRKSAAHKRRGETISLERCQVFAQHLSSTPESEIITRLYVREATSKLLARLDNQLKQGDYLLFTLHVAYDFTTKELARVNKKIGSSSSVETSIRSTRSKLLQATQTTAILEKGEQW